VVYDYRGLAGTPVADPEAVRVLRDASDATVWGAFDYDARGNLTRKTVGDDTFDMTYDSAGQLRRVCRRPEGSCETYYYKADGQRVLTFRTAFGDDGALGRLTAGATEVEYRDRGGVMAPSRTVVHAALGAMAVARIVDGDVDEPQRVYSGVLGHLLAVVDTGDRVAARYVYTPFGELLWRDGADAGDFHRLFNGKHLDDLSELGYYGARYYDRQTLTWTQRDPLYAFSPDLAYDQPRRMGLYTFVLNNPLRYIDPDGRDGKDDLSQVPQGFSMGDDGVLYEDSGEVIEMHGDAPTIMEDVTLDGHRFRTIGSLNPSYFYDARNVTSWQYFSARRIAAARGYTTAGLIVAASTARIKGFVVQSLVGTAEMFAFGWTLNGAARLWRFGRTILAADEAATAAYAAEGEARSGTRCSTIRMSSPLNSSSNPNSACRGARPT